MSYVDFHNLKPGDEIIVPKSNFNIIQHHALYLGYDEYGTHWMIHNNAGIGVSLITVNDFFKQCHQINQIIRFKGTNYERRQLIEKSLKRIGKPYNLIVYNCEHFTSEIKTGKSTSKQVELLFSGIFAAIILGVLFSAKR